LERLRAASAVAHTRVFQYLDETSSVVEAVASVLGVDGHELAVGHGRAQKRPADEELGEDVEHFFERLNVHLESERRILRRRGRVGPPVVLGHGALVVVLHRVLVGPKQYHVLEVVRKPVQAPRRHPVPGHRHAHGRGRALLRTRIGHEHAPHARLGQAHDAVRALVLVALLHVGEGRHGEVPAPVAGRREGWEGAQAGHEGRRVEEAGAAGE